MNVIVANHKKQELANLDVDVIKNISGEFEADELVAMFKNFFYDKMILDATAVKNYKNIPTIQKLSIGLGSDKLILLIPDELCSSNYLSSIISMGIYNFTNNIAAIKQLIIKPNEYKDVAKIQELGNVSREISNRVTEKNRIIGFKNITEHAGSTSLIYMIKKELKRLYGNSVFAIEVNKKDFQYFNDSNMVSVTDMELENKIKSLDKAGIILIDLNDSKNDFLCSDIIYLVEASTIKLNKLIRRDRSIFQKLGGRKIVLNKSMLTNKDVSESEYESGTKVFYNIPPLDDRGKNNLLDDFLSRLGLVDETGAIKEDAGKIFGLFKI